MSNNTAPYVRQLFLVRLGGVPDPRVTQILMPFVHENKAIAFPIPGAIVTILYTEHSTEEIATAISSAVPHYFMLSENMAFHFPPEVTNMITKKLREFGMTHHEVIDPQAAQVDLTLDDLLGLVSARGLENLTPSQRQRLEELSR